MAALAAASCMPLTLPAKAGEQRPMLWREVWAGADVSANVWLAYTGATIAPYSHIHEDGLRLRVVTGAGRYTYRGFPSSQTFEADTAFVDLLAGYLVRMRALTAKAFVGLSGIDHDIQPFDRENISIGRDWGVKGVVELWYDVSPTVYASLDLSYSTAHDTGSVRMRTGYRVWPSLSVGVEAGLDVDGQARCKLRLEAGSGCRLGDGDVEAPSLLDYARTGAFVRYEWTGGEVSVSGGVLGRMFDAGGDGDDLELDPYGTVNVIVQF
jgi:hypothetical protein